MKYPIHKFTIRSTSTGVYKLSVYPFDDTSPIVTYWPTLLMACSHVDGTYRVTQS